MKQIAQLKKLPKDIALVYLEAVLMPNGEIISNGVSFGWKATRKHIYADVFDIERWKSR